MPPYLAVVVVLAIVLAAVMVWPAGSKAPPPPSPCAGVTCSPGQSCDPATGQCAGAPPPPPGGCQGGADLTTAQPANSVQIINNTSESPFHVFLEYANYNPTQTGISLRPPPAPWAILTASPGVLLGAPVDHYPPSDAPPGVPGPVVEPNAIGSATWQEVIMPRRGDTAVFQIPAFSPGQPWSVRPLKFHDAARPCQGAEGDCGMPILIESGHDMVADMSAVDGVNFLLCYEFTTKGGASVMNFKTNPCAAAGLNRRGCTNPSVDGIFSPLLAADKSACFNDMCGVPLGCHPPVDPNKETQKLPICTGYVRCNTNGSSSCWLSDPCPAGTCNLTGASKAWCDAVNDGQCATSSSHWSDKQRGSGGPDSCAKNNLFTTYCYSHNDATSSPYLAPPYKIKLVYSDLA